MEQIWWIWEGLSYENEKIKKIYFISNPLFFFLRRKVNEQITDWDNKERKSSGDIFFYDTK